MLLPVTLSCFPLGLLAPQVVDFLLSFGDELFFSTEVSVKYFFKMR